jgi:hypothetical protein
MSAQDPRPAARRRKLVLRKIADGAARTPVAPPSSSYTGLRPTMRPPARASMQARTQDVSPSKARPALVLPLESELDGMEEAELEGEPEPEEVEPEEEVAALEASRWREIAPHTASKPARAATEAPAFEDDADDWRSSEAGAAAAMTPAAPSQSALPVRSAVRQWPAAMPARPSPASLPFSSAGIATPGPSLDPSRRSVPPVVASLPPAGMVARMPSIRGRLSVDSKVLAGGGALAAAMLLVAAGVLLGQRTAPGAPSAAATGPYPVVVEAKAPTAVALPPAAVPVDERPAGATAGVEKTEGPATIDVQQLPAAPRPRPQGWSVVASPKSAGGATGWTVAGPAPAHPVAAAAVDPPPAARPVPAAEAAEPESAQAVAPDSPGPAAAPSSAVDPLVQAVREDIREDEARTK